MADVQDPRDLKTDEPIQSGHSIKHQLHSTVRVNVTRIPLTTGITAQVFALSKSQTTQLSVPFIYVEQTNNDFTEQIKTQQCQTSINKSVINRALETSNRDVLVTSTINAKWANEDSTVLQLNPQQAAGTLHQNLQGVVVSSRPCGVKTSTAQGIAEIAKDSCTNTSHWEAVSKPPSWKSPKPMQKKSMSLPRSRSTPNKMCLPTVAFAHPESLWSVSTEEAGSNRGHMCLCSRDHCTGKISTGRVTDTKCYVVDSRTEEIEIKGSLEPNAPTCEGIQTSDYSVRTTDVSGFLNQDGVNIQEHKVKEADSCNSNDQLHIATLNTNENAKGKQGLDDCPSVPGLLPSNKDGSDRSPFGFFHNDKLFVFVPPSSDKEESGPIDVETRQEVGKKAKQSTRPLKLQSDQLMGTSKNLVERIRKKPNDIPVVIVRPKRKKPNESVSHDRTGANRKTTPTKLTSQQLLVSTSNGTTTINLKADAAADRARSPAVNREASSLHLKECFIDLGTRRSLPATVQLHGERGQLLNSAGSPVSSKSFAKEPFRTDLDHIKPSKPSFINANRNKTLPLLSDDKTSLVAEMLLFENSCNQEGKEPISVLLQTDESKTLLVMPKGENTRNPDMPVKLVRKTSPKCYRDVRFDLPHMGTGNIKTGVQRNNKARSKRTENSVDGKGTDNCINVHLTKPNTRVKNDGKKATSRVSGSDKICLSQGQGQPSLDTRIQDKPQHIQKSRSHFRRTNKSRMENLSFAMCLDLQHVLGADDPPIQQEVPVNLFKGIGQLFYAAGAQISTRDGRVTLRRAVFTVCFTSQDRYLRPQTGVPGSLPAFVAFTPDHLVSMIFTSHLCSGFFLLEPTGIVREDPNRPEVYVESALLLPYSHRLPCPTDALFLIIGPLEDDWRSSLKVATSMSQRSVPEDVVRQLIGLEDCRCFSAASVTTDTGTESACTGRRSLSTADFRRHRRRVEALSCRCRDCGAYARSRRGKRKLSDRVSLGSEDDSVHIQDDNASESRTNAPNSLAKKLEIKLSQEEMHSNINVIYTSTSHNKEYVQGSAANRNNASVVTTITRHPTKGRQGAPAVTNRNKGSASGTLPYYTHPHGQSEHDLNAFYRVASGCHRNNVVSQDVSSGQANVSLPVNQKCDKMIVKMGFPLKRTSNS